MRLQKISGDLLIAHLGANGTEWCYWFKKCMDNKLFTFYRVGYRMTSRTEPSTDNIINDSNIHWLNKTSSDNIGPIGFSSDYKDFVGGNHALAYYYYNADNEIKTGYFNGSPQGDGHTPPLVPTAQTDNVLIYADQILVAEDAILDCDEVKVQVVNTLKVPPVQRYTYDETLQLLPGLLNETLCLEFVTYMVCKNSITVLLRHEFSGGVGRQITRYYGMQSMFDGESKVMTPNGRYADFTNVINNEDPTLNVQSFTKSQYPNFNRFIERREDGWCQSAWLLDDGLGDHHLLTSDSHINIYVRAGGKSYHSLIYKYYSEGQHLPITQGMTYNWKGVYSWFTPMVNTADLLVYQGVVDGQDAIFIDAKRACSVSITTDQYSLGLRFLQQDSGITVTNTTGGLQVVATSAASAIAVQRIKGDINNDGVVDVMDASLAVDMVTGVIPVDLIADMNDDGVVDITDVGLIIDIILGN